MILPMMFVLTIGTLSTSQFASPTVLPDGHLADTPEVIAAKSAHFAEIFKATSGKTTPITSRYDYAHYYRPYYKSYYNGPLAIPTVLPDGHLADTPEVAAAKSAHFAELAKATGAKSTAIAPHYEHAHYFNPFYKSYFNGPLANPTVLPDGHLTDIPEVAAAKSAHFAEIVKATGAKSTAIAPHYENAHYLNPYFKNYYRGPLANPRVLPSGFLAETPEVAAAKSAHFAEVAKARSVAPSPITSHYEHAHFFNPYYKNFYRGLLAYPTVLPNGFLAETPEVAAAKSAHLAEVAKTRSVAPITSRYEHAHYYSLYYKTPYRGRLAYPIVLSNGFLADTPEVAAAKSAHFVYISKTLLKTRF